MMYTTLRERLEKRQAVHAWIRTAGQVAGYTLAGFTLTVAIWLYLTGLL
jgi:hypothetical protein